MAPLLYLDNDLWFGIQTEKERPQSLVSTELFDTHSNAEEYLIFMERPYNSWSILHQIFKIALSNNWIEVSRSSNCFL